MKIRTYTARDMRMAMKMIRDEQGPDAVILSTRHIEDGIEVSVAVEPVDTRTLPVLAAAPDPEPAMPVADNEFARLLVQAATAATTAPPNVAPVREVAAGTAELGAELRSMRHLLEWQVSQLAWNDLTRRAPVQAELLKELTEIGIAAPLSAELVASVPRDLNMEEAQRRVLAQLARRLPVTGDRLLEQGGRFAFVGPTGVGKTTGIAKLAARWVMRHGTRDIALISLDDQRFGAHEQLRVLGRLLGVECLVLADIAELPDMLSRLSSHRLVLIDTAGASPREAGLAERAEAMKGFATAAGVEIWLSLSAGAQVGVLEEALARFAAFQPRHVMLTKLDEAASLGGALSALISAGLPLAYVSEGSRIPEDLAPARAHQVVSRAVALARVGGVTADQDLLARRFGGLAHAVA